MGADPVGEILASRWLRVGVAAGARAPRRRSAAARTSPVAGSMNRDRVAGVVDENFSPARCSCRNTTSECARQLPVQVAEAADMCCNTCQPLCGGRIYVAN